MLDLFTIFSKGGIVLWCFQSTSEIFSPSVNALIRSVILQERSSKRVFENGPLSLQYRLDNELELVLVVAYQRILQLSYVDKLLDDVAREFRDRYKNELVSNGAGAITLTPSFTPAFKGLLANAELWAKEQAKLPKPMRSFEDSLKSKKTVASMIERKGDDKDKPKKTVKIVESVAVTNGTGGVSYATNTAGGMQSMEAMDEVAAARARLANKLTSKKKDKDNKVPKSPKPEKERSKAPRVWALGGNTRDLPTLEYTTDAADAAPLDKPLRTDAELIGRMRGAVQDLEVYSDTDDDDEEEEEEEEEGVQESQPKKAGVFSMFKGLVGSKALSAESMAPVLDKLRDHLKGKNVAADVADKLCDSVQAQLEGKVLGTFSSVQGHVRATLTDALVQILLPRRRVDILRDSVHAKEEGRPYVITFTGVNGVGKSTNLAKVCFWLMENGMSVLIAACDTFRAGAVEQLRTHVRRLQALHPKQTYGRDMVKLYEQGYGKDAAGIAASAIKAAKEEGFSVVLIDTAGRMQDNQPLMRALSKLVAINNPDLVLFVGEALVGNEAVDQLTKFNQALIDGGAGGISGILLTKFDAVDDKVGAAVSMAYATGQPVVFVGTGQTYADLKALNATAVVKALMK